MLNTAKNVFLGAISILAKYSLHYSLFDLVDCVPTLRPMKCLYSQVTKSCFDFFSCLRFVEIRRTERNSHRQMELDNLEYLKNVIFKFLAFESGKHLAKFMVSQFFLCLQFSLTDCTQLRYFTARVSKNCITLGKPYLSNG